MGLVAALLVIATMAAADTIANRERLGAISKAAEATTTPQNWTSNVRGTAFDRFYQIWLENADYSGAASDTNQQWLASQGITLTNFFAVGHTSEPNYCAAASGDNYGMNNDNFHQIPTNVSTIADLLNTKGISWAEYQQDLPYPGFQGNDYPNQQTHANDYVRKHNPLVLFNSISNNDTALRLIKNFTNFYDDLRNKQLPQWAFFTPNMTNDAHDTNITFGSQWLRDFVSELMNNTYFWDNTLLLLTFDESENYANNNRIFSILLGGAVPKKLAGTKDHTFYTHYSGIASVSANWGLPSLGRWDCGANIFQLVAEKAGYTNWNVDTTNLSLNQSLPGPLALGARSRYRSTWPVPSTNDSCSAGHGILQGVVDTYTGRAPTYNYTAPFPYDASHGLDVGVAYFRNGSTYLSGVNSTGLSTAERSSSISSSGSSSASASSSKSAAANVTVPAVNGFLAVVLWLACWVWCTYLLDV
ncbi:phosphoesterase-domain-containing protein [Xylona heveae TC161]|uniref:acid phosphatase n=1 Tax=Xylona heveae (strain CBS 132557 / TC161) TaxID=1328760 RepID=A0A165HTL3_XYLHT|nr:phosphoesterase-domain-containing protein [Xylona heveae TC161]KZF23915.1 phosphoesterase-domain-containing protein [Xylona heveae TC161]